MSRPGAILLLACLVALPAVTAAQDVAREGEAGLPYFVEHFTSRDYRHHPQNWAVAQDPRGVIYVANYDGVLEYDGAAWRFIRTPANTVARSLAVDDDGTVYVGTNGDFGYLAPDSTGLLRYVSLLAEQGVALADFTDVWGVRATDDGVYFQSFERLFRWDGRTIDMWESEREFRTSFAVDGRFYVRDRGVGLLEVRGDSLQMAPGGAWFADHPVYMMAPYGDGRILVGTSNAGFHWYDEGNLTPFATEADAWLRDAQLYHGCALPGGFFALGTLGGGVLIMDAGGRVVDVLDRAAGLTDTWVNYVFTDAQGGLWMALNAGGVARVDIPSTLSVYDDRLALEGTIRFIQRHRGALYVGTATGLSRLDPATETGRWPSFTNVLHRPTSAMVSADSVLFAATDGGLYVLGDGSPRRLTMKLVYTLAEVESGGGRILAGQEDGLYALRHTPEGWTTEGLYVGSRHRADAIQAIAEESDGTLWLRAADGSFLRIPGGSNPAVPQRFDAAAGLPQGPVHVTAVYGRATFVAPDGLYRFTEEDGGTFVRDRLLLPEADQSSPLRSLIVDGDGRFWMVHEDHVHIATPGAGGAFVHETPPVLQFPKAEVTRVFVEGDGVAWIGNGNELVRYTPRIDRPYEDAPPALVRRIVETGSERTVYGGAPMDPGASALVLAADYNNLRFDVALPSYNATEATVYRYFLEGVDDGWSDWTPRSSKIYNNLSGRTYTFHVRARNAQGVESSPAAVTLRILPPWYKTWWAYTFYASLVVFMVALAWRYRIVVEENKRAQEQARELARERLVNERLQEANRRLQEANERLQQVDRLKDEFLATTSHELRTPLTAILGFADIMQEETRGQFRELLEPISSNGQRLLRTVNSLLDLARLRAGMMAADPSVVDVGAQVAEVMRLVAPLARQKGLLLELTVPPYPVVADLDPRYLDQILNNLVGNAIKFTESGRVSVGVERENDRVNVIVRDTGIGIDESFLPFLFDDFKQESSGLARLHEGSGLGLAITARLVDLMGGEISVHSEKGHGSVFAVSFAACATTPEPTTA